MALRQFIEAQRRLYSVTTRVENRLFCLEMKSTDSNVQQLSALVIIISAGCYGSCFCSAKQPSEEGKAMKT
jgi:hypothetical protein